MLTAWAEFELQVLLSQCRMLGSRDQLFAAVQHANLIVMV